MRNKISLINKNLYVSQFYNSKIRLIIQISEFNQNKEKISSRVKIDLFKPALHI